MGCVPESGELFRDLLCFALCRGSGRSALAILLCHLPHIGTFDAGRVAVYGQVKRGVMCLFASLSSHCSDCTLVSFLFNGLRTCFHLRRFSRTAQLS